jgi:hypothetical protein
MHHAILDRGACRHERLAEHLSAKYLRGSNVAALAAKQVDLEALERQYADEILQQLVQVTPRRFCMMGLVVVY